MDDVKVNARYEHNKRVNDFLKEARSKDPKKFYDVLRRNPVVNSKKWKRIRNTEVPFSALGDM